MNFENGNNMTMDQVIALNANTIGLLEQLVEKVAADPEAPKSLHPFLTAIITAMKATNTPQLHVVFVLFAGLLKIAMETPWQLNARCDTAIRAMFPEMVQAADRSTPDAPAPTTVKTAEEPPAQSISKQFPAQGILVCGPDGKPFKSHMD